jgi:CheY-like chemotaxis protein
MGDRISLVVDDEPSVRKYIAAVLRMDHYRTVEAEDGTRGLELARELGNEVALIVSDIHMPNGDGLAFAQAVKQALPAVPIILVSGRAEPGGEFHFLRKPFPPAKLLEAVRRLVAINPAA